MSNNYSFDDVKTVMTNVAWTDQGTKRKTLSYSNITDSSLADSIDESYATIVEDDGDETRYLSVLENSHDETLEDMHNLSLNNSKESTLADGKTETVDVNLAELGEQQVVVFSLEGSDDLYGIQLAQDEEGNVQKYQFKFRTTEEGQLEAIPETIQLLSDENIIQQEPSEDPQFLALEQENTLVQGVLAIDQKQADTEAETNIYLQQNGEEGFDGEDGTETQDGNEEIGIETQEGSKELATEEEATFSIIVKGEPEEEGSETVQEGGIDDEQEIDENFSGYEEADNDEISENEHEICDVKHEMQEFISAETRTNIKREFLEGENQEDGLHIIQEDAECDVAYDDTEVDNETIVQENPDENKQSEDQTFESVQVQGEAVLDYQYDVEDNTQSEHYENMFIMKKKVENLQCVSQFQHLVTQQEDVQYVEDLNDSDNDEYEIVEGLHVTAEDLNQDTLSTVCQEPHLALQKPAALETANILKQPAFMKNEKLPKKNKTILYYLVPNPEKENVNSLPINNVPVKTNPRSILKRSVELRVLGSTDSVMEEMSKLNVNCDKRFARGREAVQARKWNNFISKTTIPHAPIRLTRLPRKQEIKPVDTRQDEEIIVQEVMVSSKGFIENMEDRLKKKDKLEVTSYVELSDSDDNCNPSNDATKEKSHKGTKQTFTTSSNVDKNVIEILHSDDELQQQNENTSVKKGRGRPKKNPNDQDETKRPRGRPPKKDEGSPPKKIRTDSSDVESDSGKKEINCPHCPKSFPSQNSLSTHIQHHNLENSLRNSRISMVEYKHKCDNCHETFKNTILLNKHVCPKKQTKLTCNVCSKPFKDVAILNIHKKTHAKEHLVKMTATVTVSPKKFIPRPSTSQFKSPRKLLNFRCKECSKAFSSQAILMQHEKLHKKFTCGNCNLSFASRILLDAHVRVSCVKTSSTRDRRLSFKIRRSFVHSPRRALTKSNNVNPGLNSVMMTRPLDVKAQCDSCTMKFTTLTALFKHKVKDHGLHTPDKTVLLPKKKTLHRPLNVHGGIPANDRLNKAFQGMRRKLELSKISDTTLLTDAAVE